MELWGSFFQTIFDGGRLIAQLDAAEAVKWLIDVYTALGGGWVIKPQENECDSENSDGRED